MKWEVSFIEDCSHCRSYSSGCCRQVPEAAGIGEDHLKNKTFPHWCPKSDVPEKRKHGDQFSDAPDMYNW